MPLNFIGQKTVVIQKGLNQNGVTILSNKINMLAIGIMAICGLTTSNIASANDSNILGVNNNQPNIVTVTNNPGTEQLIPDIIILREEFIDKFIEDNEILSIESKNFLVSYTRENRGPWDHKDFVVGVTEYGERIIVICDSGTEAYYYPPHLSKN